MGEMVLFEDQKNVLNLVRQAFLEGHRSVMLYGPTGFGKCLGKDTPVLMADGSTKLVQNVLVGDQLLGPDGGVRNVLSLATGQEMLYRITPKSGDAYVVNASHILSLRKTPGSDGLKLSDGSLVARDADIVNVNVETLNLSNATTKHCLKGWRSGAVEFHREPEDLLLDPYWLGCWLGDGRSDTPVLCKPMCKMVEWWIEHPKQFGYSVTEYRYGDGCPTWGVVGGEGYNIFCGALSTYGLVNNKHVPDDFLYGPVDVRLKVIAGLLDSDGSLHKGCYDWISKDKRLAEQLAFLCRSVGLSAYITECQKGIKSLGFVGTYWRVSISGETEVIPCLDKRAGPRAQKKRSQVHGITIEPIGVGDYYGFQIDGDHLFLLGDFTVTHNTECAISMLNATAAKQNTAAMILDRIVLCNQTSARLDKYRIDHGVLQAGHWRHRPYEKIQVCSAQTLEKRGSLPGMKLLVVDEAHAQRKQTTTFIQNNKDVRVVGLSASPFANGLGNTYTKVVSATTTAKLVEAKRLTPLRVFIAKEVDMTGAKKVAGEWSTDEAASRAMQITGDVVAEWVKKTTELFGGPRKTIVFCSNVAHGADLAQRFAEAGYNFVPISYKDSDDFKADAVKDFSSPDTSIHGLIACDILTKGFDVPDVMIGVSARPFSKSFMSHVQQMGRVMRSYPGKDFAVWLCHSGNYLRFQEDWDELYHEGVHELKDGKEKAKKEPSDKEKEQAKCPKCGALWIGKSDNCVACGYHRPFVNLVDEVPGEMVELEAARNRAEKQDFYSQLLGIARKSGYSDGWAGNKFKEKFGSYPRGLSEVAIPVTQKVASWVKSRQIAWAKSKYNRSA